MARFIPTQYYGYFDYTENPIFHIVLIKPAGSGLRDWIGSRDAAIANMLCIDDLILSSFQFSVDWSEVQNVKN